MELLCTLGPVVIFFALAVVVIAVPVLLILIYVRLGGLSKQSSVWNQRSSANSMIFANRQILTQRSPEVPSDLSGAI